MNKETKQLAALEALLFVHGEPLSFVKIAKILEVDEATVRGLAKTLEERLADEERGLMLVLGGERAQLATKPAFAKIVEGFVKAELAEELTPASLETLAIIAYFGPVTKARIDYQRGVNSAFILRNLMIRGLILRATDPAHPTSYVYRPSFLLLTHLGLARQEDLPDYENYRQLLAKFEAELRGEPGSTTAIE
ncbi:MAG: SMC-Scp complex subunit ScpB [Patescibacteria group bacterium]